MTLETPSILASIDFFGTTFDQSLFGAYNHYNAWDPGTNQYWQSSMSVYGDTTIHIAPTTLTLATNINYPVTVTLNGVQIGLGSSHLWGGQTYTITANGAPGYTFDHFDYNGQTYGSPATIQMNTNGVLTAYYNGNPPPVYHTLTLFAYDCYFGEQLPAGIYIDGQPVGTGYAQYQVQEGFHTIEFDSSVWNDWWNTYSNLYMVVDYNSGYQIGNPAWIYIGADDTIAAAYAP